MNSNRKRTIISGVLYIVGTISGLLRIAPATDQNSFPGGYLFGALQVLYLPYLRAF